MSYQPVKPFVLSLGQDLEPAAKYPGAENSRGACGTDLKMQFFQIFDHWRKLLMIGAYGLRRAITQSENHQFWEDQKTGGGTEFDLVDKPQYEEHRYQKRQGDHNGERRLMGCINPALGAPLDDGK
jgi:hypothetical protein